MKRKFGKTGPWIYKGKQIDSYELSKWLINRYQRTGVKIRPSQVTIPLIKEFLQDKKK